MRMITMEPTIAADENYRSHPRGLYGKDPNPIMQSKYMTDDTKLNRTMGNAFVKLDILPGLMLKGQVGLDLRNELFLQHEQHQLCFWVHLAQVLNHSAWQQ